MLFSWWMWLGGVAVLVAALSGLHWTLLDFLLDRIGTRADSLRERGSRHGGDATELS